MFLHVYFPHLVSSLIEIHCCSSEVNAVENFEHLENVCREGQSFLMTEMKLHWHVNRYPYHFVNPLPQPCYCSTIPHMVEARQYFVSTVVAVRIITSTSKNSTLCLLSPSSPILELSFLEFCGSGPKILNDWCSKRTLQEPFIQDCLYEWFFRSRSTKQ